MDLHLMIQVSSLVLVIMSSPVVESRPILACRGVPLVDQSRTVDMPQATVTMSAEERRIYLECVAPYPVEFHLDPESFDEEIQKQIENNLQKTYEFEGETFKIRTFIEFRSDSPFKLLTTCKPLHNGREISERVVYGKYEFSGDEEIPDCVYFVRSTWKLPVSLQGRSEYVAWISPTTRHGILYFLIFIVVLLVSFAYGFIIGSGSVLWGLVIPKESRRAMMGKQKTLGTYGRKCMEGGRETRV